MFCVEDKPAVADSFSKVYEPVIRSPADAQVVKGMADPVRKRIERNDTVYRCANGWKNPICGKAR